jgi:hypothetical protein
MVGLAGTASTAAVVLMVAAAVCGELTAGFRIRQTRTVPPQKSLSAMELSCYLARTIAPAVISHVRLALQEAASISCYLARKIDAAGTSQHFLRNAAGTSKHFSNASFHELSFCRHLFFKFDVTYLCLLCFLPWHVEHFELLEVALLGELILDCCLRLQQLKQHSFHG